LPRRAEREKQTVAAGHRISIHGRASIAGAAGSFSRSAYLSAHHRPMGKCAIHFTFSRDAIAERCFSRDAIAERCFPTMPIPSILGGAVSGTSAAFGSAAKGGGDAFAALLQRAKEASSPTAGSANTSATVGNLTRDAETKFSEFKRAVQQLFSAAGIDTGTPIVLESDGIGGITVNADHPDQDKIAALLQSNPDLIDKFHAVREAYRAVRSSSGTSEEEIALQTFRIAFEDDRARVRFE
jgi:hypothetical protein